MVVVNNLKEESIMKTIFKTAICLSVMLMASSCVLDSIDSQPAADPRLECDALESYTVQAVKPQDVSFSISATTPWTITGFENASWVTVTPASSSVSSLAEDIRIVAAENPDTEERSVVLTVKGENVATTYSVKLTQARRGKLVVTPIPASDAFAAAGGSKTFTVQANQEWEASVADSWLSLTPASGSSSGDMKSFSVTAKAEANSSLNRSTTVTVIAGDDKVEFTVNQLGQSLEISQPAFTEVDRKGGEFELDVNATMDWKAECNVPEVTLTKASNSKLKVNVPWNNKFAPRTVKITIKPTSASYGDVSSSVEFTQDINFEFSGHCEVLEDGSVKIYGDDKSRVKMKDRARYVNIIIKMGDKSNFCDKAQMWTYANDAVEGVEIEIQNQIQLGKRIRVRLNGHLPKSGESCYDSKDYEITKDELNAMKEYRVDVVPGTNSTNGVQHLNFSFSYNGTLRSDVLDKPSIFADTPDSGCHYWFGCYDASNDGTWYVVKSCDVIPVAE